MLVIAIALLSGCAAKVSKGAVADGPLPSYAPLSIPADSSRNIVLNVTGSTISTQAKDWQTMQGEWLFGMIPAARSVGSALTLQAGEPKATSETGVLIVLHVNDYRLISPHARRFLGVMTGNAYLDVRVDYRDLATGNQFGTRSYNTSSSAWEGIYSAMSDKQVEAICKEIVKELNRPGVW